MQIGDTLRDEGRYEIAELVENGRSFQIVRCLDREYDDREVYAKAPIVDPEADDAEERRQQWREAVAAEAEVLQGDIDALPTFVETTEVTVEGRGAPVLIYEPIGGDNLYEYVAKRAPGTIPVEAQLAVVRAVGQVCRQLHDEGLLFRDLDPHHVIVSEDCELRGMVGTGNITPIEERPNPVTSELSDASYVAPEIRNERSGETLRPAADVYAIGALSSYVFTAQIPTSAVESPLEPEAYEALRKALADGLEELVASGLQPIAKHRVSLQDFIAHCDETGLAELTDPERRSELDIQPLPEPWSGAQPPEVNRGEQSNLSAGPLISVPSEEGRSPDGEALEGVKSAPVEEFLGERDDEVSEETSRKRETGEPVREVSMVDENLGEGQAPPETAPMAEERTEAQERAEAAEWEKRAAQSPLPPLSELPLKIRVAVGVGLPVLAIAIVVLLGFLGVY